MLAQVGYNPDAGSTIVLLVLIAFTLIYGALAVNFPRFTMYATACFIIAFWLAYYFDKF